jgi:hypothetical protein
MIGSADNARANIYSRLAVLEKSGLPIAHGVARLIEGGGPAQTLLEPVLAAMTDGEDIGTAFANAGDISALEVQVIADAEVVVDVGCDSGIR